VTEVFGHARFSSPGNRVHRRGRGGRAVRGLRDRHRVGASRARRARAGLRALSLRHPLDAPAVARRPGRTASHGRPRPCPPARCAPADHGLRRRRRLCGPVVLHTGRRRRLRDVRAADRTGRRARGHRRGGGSTDPRGRAGHRSAVVGGSLRRRSLYRRKRRARGACPPGRRGGRPPQYGGPARRRHPAPIVRTERTGLLLRLLARRSGRPAAHRGPMAKRSRSRHRVPLRRRLAAESRPAARAARRTGWRARRAQVSGGDRAPARTSTAPA
jgi:hypothetical protein